MSCCLKTSVRHHHQPGIDRSEIQSPPILPANAPAPPRRDMHPVEPETERPVELRAAGLGHGLRVQTKEVRAARGPVQDDGEEDAVVFVILFACFFLLLWSPSRDEDRLSGALTVLAPGESRAGLHVVLDEAVEEGGFACACDAVDVARGPQHVGRIEGREFGAV